VTVRPAVEPPHERVGVTVRCRWFFSSPLSNANNADNPAHATNDPSPFGERDDRRAWEALCPAPGALA
jgi:hypothetical protein